MKKENWNISYAKLAYEHKWGGVITSFLSLIGFCFLVNHIALEFNTGNIIPGSINQQMLAVAIIVVIHTLFVPKIAALAVKH